MTAYKELDEAICAHVETGSTWHPIYVTHLAQMAARELGPDISESDKRVWKLIDKRLQAMKRAGLLREEAGELRGEPPRWVLVQP